MTILAGHRDSVCNLEDHSASRALCYSGRHRWADQGPGLLDIKVRPYLKNNQQKKNKKTGGVAQVVEHQPKQVGDLEFNP
jgi:hypothetical protein